MANETSDSLALLDGQFRCFDGFDLICHEFIDHLLQTLCLELHQIGEEDSLGIHLLDHNFLARRHHPKDLAENGEK